MNLSRRGLLGALGLLPFVGKKREPEARISVPLPPSDLPGSQPNRTASFPNSEWESLKNLTPTTLEKGDVVQLALSGGAAVRPTRYSKARFAVSLERVPPGEYGRFATYGVTYARIYTTAQANFAIKAAEAVHLG